MGIIQVGSKYATHYINHIDFPLERPVKHKNGETPNGMLQFAVRNESML